MDHFSRVFVYYYRRYFISGAGLFPIAIKKFKSETDDASMKMRTKIIFIASIAIFFLLVYFINEHFQTKTVTSSLLGAIQNIETNIYDSDDSGIKEKKTSFTERISEKGPELRFDLYGEFVDGNLRHGHMEVFDTTKSKRIQKIIINNNYDIGHFDWNIGGFEHKGHEIQMVDLNFDGYLDLRLLDNEGVTGNDWYASYLYKPGLKQFVFHRKLSTLSGVRVFPDSKRIITFNHASACSEYMEFYKILKDQLILIKTEWTQISGTRDDGSGEVVCPIYTGKPRNGNIKIDVNEVLYGNDPMSYMKEKMINIKKISDFSVSGQNEYGIE